MEVSMVIRLFVTAASRKYIMQLMEEILHQLIGSLSHRYNVFIYTYQVVVWDFFHQQTVSNLCHVKTS